jgi:serine-type D-Ala-D-Ala carboxypeptidase (penicillin-binding protein 5/6)
MTARRAGAAIASAAAVVVLALPAAASSSSVVRRAGDSASEAGPAGLVPAAALLVYQPDTGTVVFSDNGDEELPIASTTKLMTAFVAVEHLRAERVLTEQPYAATPGESLAGIPAGARLSLADMLRAMLLPSGNDVAHSLAIDVGGSVDGFVAQMNFWAGLLRLGRTHYTTPVGLDQPGGNYSTALDLARLTAVLLRDPLVASIVRQPSATLGDGLVVHNRNDLLAGNPWVIGVKTGSTVDAGYCMVGAGREHGVRVISVVLGAPTVAARDNDTLALLRYGLSRFRRARIARAGQLVGLLQVAGRSRRAAVVTGRSSSLVVGAAVHVHAALRLPSRLTGPLPAGTRVGAIVARVGGRRAATVPLVTAAAVPAPRPAAASPGDRPLLWMAAGVGVGIVLVGCSLPFMRKRSARAALEVS